MPIQVKPYLQGLFDSIKQYRSRQYILRILTALSFAWVVIYLRSETPFTEHLFYYNINLPLLIVSAVILSAFLCLIKNDRIISIILVVALEIYFVSAANEIRDYFFSFGLCMLLCAVVIFADLNIPKTKLKSYILWGIVSLLMIAFTLFVGILCCLFYKDYQTPCYDFGLFSQMFYYMKETGECLTTCERDVLLSHFAVHFSPIYYVLLPIYALIPSPCTLLVAQAAIVSGGVIPLVLLCKHYKLSDISAILFSVCYLLYPSFLGGCFWYMHENCFLAPLILWYIYFSEKEKIVPTAVFALLTLTVKEDAAVYVAVVALYFIFIRKNYKCNLCVFAFSIVYFIIVTGLMSVFGEGIMSDSRYGDYIYDDGGLFTVIKSVIQNPIYAIQQVFKEEKLLFILQMLAPLGFLPLAIRKPSKLILLIPFIIVNLMTSYIYQHHVGYQYTFGSGSILFYLAVANYGEMGRRHGKILLCSALASIIIFSGGYYNKIDFYETYKNNTEKREIINDALTYIPDDASVASSTFILTNLSQRKVLYEVESTHQTAEYIVLDLRFYADEYSVYDYLNEDYETVYYYDDVIAIFRKG